MPFDPIEATPCQKRPPASAASSFILTGRHVLAAMALFFAVVAGVNGLMMSQAIRTMPGLDARNGYDVSQAYNSSIEAAAAQAARGWRIEASVARKPDGTLVAADILSSANAPLAGAAVRAVLAHPATRQLDRALTLVETRPGHYEALVEGLAAGAWTLVLRVDQPGAAGPAAATPAFVSRNRIMVEG